MNFDGNKRNMTFFLVMLLVICFLVPINVVANNQNQEYLRNYLLYQQIGPAIGQANYEKVFDIVEKMSPDFRKSYQVQASLAYALAYKGKFNQANSIMNNLQKDYPHLVFSADYLAIFGAILHLQGEYSTAKIYLESSLQYNPSEPILQEVNHILEDVNSRNLDNE